MSRLSYEKCKKKQHIIQLLSIENFAIFCYILKSIIARGLKLNQLIENDKKIIWCDNHRADQRLCFRHINNVIPLLPKHLALLYGWTARFVSDQVDKLDDRFSREATQIEYIILSRGNCPLWKGDTGCCVCMDSSLCLANQLCSQSLSVYTDSRC